MSASKRSFLFDRMLGKLCTKMRMLGVDAALNAEGETGRFLLNAAREKRTAVTRSHQMSDRPGPLAIVLESETVEDQIVELFRTLCESPSFEPFTRCLRCNVRLVEEPAETARAEAPPMVQKSFTKFHRCPRCRRLYWEGTHFQAMAEEVRRIEQAFAR